jgi:hypothetical protein
MKYALAIFCFLFLSTGLFAQDTAEVAEASTGFRADGKIYVVVAVVVTLLIGFVIYMISLDRKITRIEKQNL